jgi:hypothetical protein
MNDMNEDLNNPNSNKPNQYLLDFIRESKLILKEGGHLPFLVFRRLVFSLNHPVWAGQDDQFHFSK